MVGAARLVGDLTEEDRLSYARGGLRVSPGDDVIRAYTATFGAEEVPRRVPKATAKLPTARSTCCCARTDAPGISRAGARGR